MDGGGRGEAGDVRSALAREVAAVARTYERQAAELRARRDRYARGDALGGPGAADGSDEAAAALDAARAGRRAWALDNVAARLARAGASPRTLRWVQEFARRRAAEDTTCRPVYERAEADVGRLLELLPPAPAARPPRTRLTPWQLERRRLAGRGSDRSSYDVDVDAAAALARALLQADPGLSPGGERRP